MEKNRKISTRNTKKQKKVLIALISNRETLPTSFVSSLFSLYEYTKQFYNCKIQVINSTYVCQMRNIAIEFAKANKFDYVFQIDTDMIYPANSIVELIKHKKDIVGGLYYTRKTPHTPVHWKNASLSLHKQKNREQFESGKLTRVGASGGGGVLIKVKALRKIKGPYYKVTYRNYGKQTIGEDIYFCRKIKNKLKFYIDPTIKYAHLHQVAITGQNEIKEIQ